MLGPRSRRVALAALLVVLLSGCQLPWSSRTVRVHELGVQLTVPRSLADLVYVIGEGGEGKSAAFFSTRKLARVGGRSCAAGAQGAVSPFPLGSIIVTDEDPAKVAAEVKENPDEGLGKYVKRVGDRYLYYTRPPDEPCAPGNERATKLQREAAAALRKALKSARAS